MTKILSLFLTVIYCIFYSQKLEIKILNTEVIAKKNIIIRIEINNKSQELYCYNKNIRVKDSKNDNFTNKIYFYNDDKAQNVIDIHYKKYSQRFDRPIYIRPNSRKEITINLKKDLPRESYNGLYFILNVLELKSPKYILKLYFKNEQNEFESYEISDLIKIGNENK